MTGSMPSPRNSYHAYVLTHPKEGKRISSLMESGRQFMGNDDLDAARRVFLQILNIYPRVVPALNNLAIIAMQHGDMRRALDIVHQVMETDDADPIAHSLAAQCWYHEDSLPLMQFHADKALAGYMQLLEQGDPIDPQYADRAFPFLLNVLLGAEDDAAITALYNKGPSLPWNAPGLTWVGIALFNQGHINEAYLVWQRVKRYEQFEPAKVYAALAQHALSLDVLPFRLDYELGMSVEDEFSHYAYSTLMVATALHDLFRADSTEAQRLLGDLADLDMPGEQYFLRRLVQNGGLPWGVRLAAAVQLLWLGDNDALILDVWSEADEADLLPTDEAAYCLLTLTLAQTSHVLSAEDITNMGAAGAKMAALNKVPWIAEAIRDVLELHEHDDAEHGTGNNDQTAGYPAKGTTGHGNNNGNAMQTGPARVHRFPTYWDGNDE